MTDGVAIRTDLTQQVQAYVEEIVSFREKLREWGADHFEDIRMREAQLQALEKAAQRTKLTDLQKEIAVTKIEIARWIGEHLSDDTLTPSDTTDMDRMTRSRYKQIYDMPEYVYDHAMETAVMPSVNSLLLERKRYVGLRAAVKAAGKDKAKLKAMVNTGYSVFQAERELTGADNVDLGIDLSADEVTLNLSFDNETFDTVVDSLENLADKLTEVMNNPTVKFTKVGYRESVEVLRRLLKTTKHFSAMFMEVKRSLKENG